jgi:hypothetical protein
MSRTKRWLAGVSLAVYLLATTTVHFLHDHSAAEHCGHAHESHVSHDETAQPGHETPACPSHNCEDTCFACQFLAVKSIAPTVVAVVEQVEVLRPVEAPQSVRIPAIRPALPLSRGPPCV